MLGKSAGPDYQAIAMEFSPGDVVVPFGAAREFAGRVVTVFPAIGMVDVEFPTGSKRYPAEDLLRIDDAGNVDPPYEEYVPGGAGTVSVPGGPFAVEARTKTALYWAAKDRQYRATYEELNSGNYTCPKCKEAALRKAIYRRIKGQSEHLFGCPTCLFLISRESVIHPELGV